jgi:hypothetical protein
MGYRSDVVALIYPDMTHDGDDSVAKYEQLKTLMNTRFKQLVDDFGSCMEWIDVDQVLKFDIKDINWYSTASGVIRFEDMLATLNGDPNDGDDVIGGYCTEFVRVGEESTDVVQDHVGNNVQFYLNVSHSIDCNV